MRPAKHLQAIPLTAPASASNEAASNVLLSAVAGTVIGNYTICHAIVENLTALQDWVRANTEPGP